MAGGIGSRLWPASTPEIPKQFIDILGVGKSLIQLTVDRFLPVCDKSDFWVVTSERYVDIVRQQLPDIPSEHILAEPEPRNTAPCIAYACWKIAQKHPEANVVVTPADALVIDTAAFADIISSALDFTDKNDAIVTVGIVPVRPETGYGYIHADNAVEGEVCKVSEFKEKPDLATAMSYLKNGGYFWNAGIFVWNVRTITSQLRKFAPQIAGVMDQIAPAFYTDHEAETLKSLFPQCDKISIDYAVMEKSESIYVVTGNPGWSDLGSWGSVKTHIREDGDGNSVVGANVHLFSCHNCIVHLPEEKKAVIQGLDGYIVTHKDGQLLVCSLSDEQHIKEYSTAK